MMGCFQRLINDLGLKEIPLHGRKFTWTNNHVSVKLDRVLCSVEWEELFSNCLLQFAASDDSDHCPLILGMNDIKPGKRRFHFESFWPKLDGFQEAVDEVWNSAPVVPCPFETLYRKLQATSKKITRLESEDCGTCQNPTWSCKGSVASIGNRPGWSCINTNRDLAKEFSHEAYSRAFFSSTDHKATSV